MGNKKILLIEDDHRAAKLFRKILNLHNYQVLEAEDAAIGIQIAREHRPDLILMDLELPGIDGLDATRLMKKDLELKIIPVVALTAHAMRGDEQEAREAGCDGYISKPVTIRNFLKKIRQYLTRGGASKKVYEVIST